MFGLLKDTRVVGKAHTLIQRPPKDIFDFVGANFLTNYPRWSPEVVELKPLTEGPVKVGTYVTRFGSTRADVRSQLSRSWLFNLANAFASKGYPTPTDATIFLIYAGRGDRQELSFPARRGQGARREIAAAQRDK